MKKIYSVLVLSVCLVVVSIGAFAQSTSGFSNKIAPELLRHDLATLHDTLQKVHPGLYRYKSKQMIDQLFAESLARIDRPMTTIEYYGIISHVVSGIEDGHTECFLPNNLIGEVMGGVKIFPIQLRFIGRQAFVPCDTKTFSAGTEIVAIDGKPIDAIRQELFDHLSSDGSIQTGKYVKVNEGHDPFSYLYLVAYGYKEEFKVAYRNAQGSGVKVLQAGLFGEMECPPAEEQVSRYLNLEYRPDHVAVLTIKSFANERMEKTGEHYADFLAASFAAIKAKKVERLVIDLRENDGGDDGNGELLYAYLTNRPFSYYASVGSVSENFKPEEHPNLAIQQPRESNFSGKVYFLVRGKTYSSAAEFSSVAKSNNRGIFIGEETGGGYYGNTSGARATFFLPASGIRVNLPLNKYVTAVKKTNLKDRGVIPDHVVVPSIDDILQHKDVQLAYALKMAEQNK